MVFKDLVSLILKPIKMNIIIKCKIKSDYKYAKYSNIKYFKDLDEINYIIIINNS